MLHIPDDIVARFEALLWMRSALKCISTIEVHDTNDSYGSLCGLPNYVEF